MLVVMTEIISSSQVQDANGRFAEASRAFSPADVEIVASVPRPDFKSVLGNMCMQQAPIKNGALLLGPNQAALTRQFPGLRGLVSYRANGKTVQAPAIVLPDCTGRVAILTAEREPRSFTPLTHALLENLYVTQDPNIVAHGGGNRVAPAVGGHALLAASLVGNPQGAHDKVHSLARQNFGTAFDAEARRDIAFGPRGHNVLAVRSAVLPLAQVVLEVGEGHQPAPDNGLGLGMSPGELNVAMTVAATLSHQPRGFDMRANMGAMVF